MRPCGEQLRAGVADQRAGHLGVHTGVERQRRGRGAVGGDPVPALPRVGCPGRAGTHLGHGGPVALDEPVKAPLALEDPVHRVVVAAARHAVDRVERAHGRVRAGVDRRLERRQVEVAQPLLGQVGGVVVTAALRLAVGREVLGAGHELVGCAVVGSLDRLDARRPEHRVQVGVLPGGLGDPAPARLVRHVDHRRIGLLEPDNGRLARAVLVVVEGHLRVEARAGGKRDREDGAEAMDGVEGEQHRDLQPRLLNGNALQLPDPRRIGHAQDRAQPVAHLLLGDKEVRQELDLLQLLLERHLREQVAHPRLDSLVGRLPGGPERLLVAGLPRGHHTTRGCQHERQDRQDDRSPEPEPPHGLLLVADFRLGNQQKQPKMCHTRRSAFSVTDPSGGVELEPAAAVPAHLLVELVAADEAERVGDVVGRLLRSGAGQLTNCRPRRPRAAGSSAGRGRSTRPDALVEPPCPRLVGRGLGGRAAVAGRVSSIVSATWSIRRENSILVRPSQESRSSRNQSSSSARMHGTADAVGTDWAMRTICLSSWPRMGCTAGPAGAC